MRRQGARRLEGAVLACLAIWPCGPAAAEEEEPEPVLLEEIVVRLPHSEAPGDPTGSATVVESRKYQGEAKSVAELVSTAPGVAVNQYGGLGQLTTVSIRGSTATQVKVLLDGLSLNTGGDEGVDLSTIPQAWVERIEVVRGAEGAHYGAGSLGGVVNVVTRPAAAGAWSAQSTAGSFLTFSAATDAAEGGQGWAALGALAVDSTSGRFPYFFDPQPSLAGNPLRLTWREHDAVRRLGGLLKGWARVGEGRVDVLGQASTVSRDLPGVPYALTPSDWQQDARATLLARYVRPLAPGLSLSARASARWDRLDLALAALGPTVRQRGGAAGGEVGLVWLHGPGTLAAGASAAGERLTGSGLGEARQRPELAAWVSEEVVLLGGRLRLAPALRGERVGPFEGLSGKLGSTLRLGGPLSLRASGGRSFRAPSFDELYLQQGILEPNPALVPEEAWSADAALVADGALGFASAGAFATLYRNLIVYEVVGPLRARPFNDGKALARGLEVEAASSPAPGLAGFAAAVAYTLLVTETLRGDEGLLGAELPQRPRHRLYARAALGDPGAGVHAEAHWTSSQWQDARNRLPIAPALALNAGGFVRLLARPDLRLSLEVKNLLDDRTLQDGFGNPLPSRTVLFGLRAGNPAEGG